MKRAGGDLTTRVKRMKIGGQDADATHNTETAVDPIRQDWHIFRGPPDYTHVSLPFIFEQRIQNPLYQWDFGFRMTSPYDPLLTTNQTDINPGAGLARTGVLQSNLGDTKDKYGNAQYFNFYADMYKYYNVLGCRYHITVENLSGERLYVHFMHYNQEQPPANASNNDILLWKNSTSYLSTPHAMFFNDNQAAFNDFAALQDETDDDLNSTPNPSTIATPDPAQWAVSRNQNTAVIQHSSEYSPGDWRREIILDGEVSTWTPINTNPTYPERLLIRVKHYDDNTFPAAGNALNYEKSMHFVLKAKIEYLCEFKELNYALRYPVQRDPARVTLFGDNR